MPFLSSGRRFSCNFMLIIEKVCETAQRIRRLSWSFTTFCQRKIRKTVERKKGKDSRPAVFAFLIKFVSVSVWPAFNHRP